MPICSYVAITAQGAAPSLAQRLAALAGCDDARVAAPDTLLVVTDTAGPDEEHSLRERIASLDGVRALVLVFGEIAAEATSSASSHGTLPHVNLQ